MKKKKIQFKTCFALGMAGACMGILSGMLLLISQSEARFVRIASFALYGILLLFLSTMEQGKERQGRRTKLLLLFFALLLSYFNLPPVSTLLEALVIPLLSFLYRNKTGKLQRVLLLALEAAQWVLRTLSILPLMGSWTQPVLGISLILVSSARLWIFFAAYKCSESPTAG